MSPWLSDNAYQTWLSDDGPKIFGGNFSVQREGSQPGFKLARLYQPDNLFKIAFAGER